LIVHFGVIPTMFQLGEHYTRQQIHDAIGGGLVEFLPHKGGHVVCAALTPKQNPDAPDTILVGGGKSILRWGEQLATQHDAIPVFIKDAANRWRFVGEYAAVGRETDEQTLTEYRHRVDHEDVVFAIQMQRKTVA
jgi:hypothetical protein